MVGLVLLPQVIQPSVKQALMAVFDALGNFEFVDQLLINKQKIEANAGNNDSFHHPEAIHHHS